MEYPILIVGARITVQHLIMYRANGETITVDQGDPRIRDLVAKLTPALEKWPNNYWLTEADMAGKNHYAEAEKKTSGLVRFFKVAKSKLKEIVEKFIEPLAPMELGSQPSKEPVHLVDGEPVDEEDDFPVPDFPAEEDRPLTKSLEAVAEIMANAVKPTDMGFAHVSGVAGEEETIVAVLGDNTVIPGVEQISLQMQAVSESVGTGDGLAKFLHRMSLVRRGHSAEDLLKFMKQGELPLTDDGCALVYKRLSTTDVEGTFVDVHSGRVKQRVGSFVHMAENMVDGNRRVDCSNGLHVARRDYLKAFSGNVTVLAKLAPEDVIAVPQYDARKLRAKGYHIIAVLSDDDARRVNNNQPMQDTQLLADAVAGNHVGILEYVEITAAKGGGLQITPAAQVVAQPVVDVSERTVHSLDHLNGQSEESSSVDARKLALDLAAPRTDTTIEDGKVTDVKQLITAPPGGYADGDSYRQPVEPRVPAIPVPLPYLVPAVVPGSAKRPVEILLQAFKDSVGGDRLPSAKALLDYKKQCKKSWTALGIAIIDWEAAANVVFDHEAAGKPKVIPNPPCMPVVEKALAEAKPAKVKKAAPPLKPPGIKTKNKAVAKPTTPAVEAVAKALPKTAPKSDDKMIKRSQAEEAQHLWELYQKNPDVPNARALVAFKTKSKKSWTVLGLTDEIGKRMLNRVK